MKTLILFLVKKFLTPKRIASLLAGIIANLLRKASKTGNWDTVKDIISKTENACHLFNEVYSDDNLSKEEEEKIAGAIAGLTTSENIKRILNKVDPML